MFSASVEVVLTIAYREAVSRRHAYVTLEHLLYALAHDNDGERILAACGTDLAPPAPRSGRLPQPVDRAAEARRPARARADGRVPPRAADGRAARPERAARGSRSGRSLRRDPAAAEDACRAAAGRAGRHAARCARIHLARDLEDAGARRRRGRRARRRRGRRATKARPTARDPLTAYCTNLTERARQGLLDPLIGRADELQRTIEVLCRRRKNNPVFVGDAGVGKTAMAEGLAMRLLADDVQEALKGAEIFALDTAGLLAGTRFRGDFEERFKAVIKALSGKAEGDPLHRRNPLDGGRRRDDRRHDGPRDADQADPDRRRPARHRLDHLRRVQAHRKGSRARAPAAEDRDRRADRSKRRSRSSPACRSRYEEHHRVKYTDAALEAAVKLAARHLRDYRLPDSAIDLIDETGSVVRLAAPPPPDQPDPAALIRPACATRPADRRRRGHRARRRADCAHPGAPGVVVRSRAAAHARGIAPARRVRPARRRAPRGAGHQAIARRPRPARSPGRLLPVHRADRRRQDRAGQAAGDSARQRVHPLRHERVHGEARGRAADRRAAGIRRVRAGRAAGRHRAHASVQRRAARRDREGAPGHLQHPAPGDGPRDADRQHRPEGRLPQRRADSHVERRLARDERAVDRVRRQRHRRRARRPHPQAPRTAARRPRSSASSARSSATGSTRSSRSGR